MDPVSVAGLALGVASLGVQVYTGCIQGIQLLVTALGYGDECRYLNLRLRMEQQRLFAWSETSGLLDLDAGCQDRVLGSNIFGLHRQTALDLLVQIRCLFAEFSAHQRRHRNLEPVYGPDPDHVLESPDMDARRAGFPMSPRKRDFIARAMASLERSSADGWTRLRWISLDKEAFEGLLAKFSALNDAITSLLDHSLQAEMRHTVQDTNRGVLLLHHKVADLGHLVLALTSQLGAAAAAAAAGQGPPGNPVAAPSPASRHGREAGLDALHHLSALARFKAFSEAIDGRSGEPPTTADAAACRLVELASPGGPRAVQVPRHLIELDPEAADDWEAARCAAMLKTPDGAAREIWIEWRDYGTPGLHPGPLSRRDTMDRVGKLAQLLGYSPKPEAFCTPHCLGFFDKADPTRPDKDVDVLDRRLGLLFERLRRDGDGHARAPPPPPVSLRELLSGTSVRKPSVTERVRLGHALAHCLLHLHAVNWLHKGLRSHNVLLFRDGDGQRVDYARPCLSGFGLSRPSGRAEATDAPGDDAEHDLYRHPSAQSDLADAQRARSTKSLDVYGLGVVLVELAHWKTVDAVLAIDVRRAHADREAVRRARERLLGDEAVADVGAEMGQRYAAATRACLAGGRTLGLLPGDDEADDEVAQRLSTRFDECVVKALGSIVV